MSEKPTPYLSAGLLLSPLAALSLALWLGPSYFPWILEGIRFYAALVLALLGGALLSADAAPRPGRMLALLPYPLVALAALFPTPTMSLAILAASFLGSAMDDRAGRTEKGRWHKATALGAVLCLAVALSRLMIR